MIRRTPATYRVTPWHFVLAITVLGFMLEACAEPRSTQRDSEPTAPQLAASGATSCVAPCVEVEVKVKPRSRPAAGVVVTLVQGGQSGVGPFDQSGDYNPPSSPGTLPGKPLVALTDENGVATFGSDFDLIGSNPELGYCALVRPLTSVSDATAGNTFVVPNAAAPHPSASWQGAVTGERNRSEVLNKANYLDNCVSWQTTSEAPFVVTPTSAVRVSLTMNAASAALEVLCRYFDGGESPTGSPADEECPTWALIDLSDEQIPWVPEDLEQGVQIGLLASASGGVNAASNLGLAFQESYDVEAALQGTDRQYTASLSQKETPRGGKKGNGTTVATADLDPLVCAEVTDPLESEGEVTEGVDFLDPISDGYLGLLPLIGALFIADAEHVTIFYDQVHRGGSGEVTLHMRAKPNPYFEPDEYPSTMNKLVTYDFTACPAEQPQFISETGAAELIVEVECRRDLDDSAITHVVWSITIPGTRVVEWRLQTPFDESHPEEARSDDPRAMRPIVYPVGEDGDVGGDNDCPLANSTIGKSNDPKWWIGSG